MEASYRLPKNFRDMTQGHLATRFRILKRICKQARPHPFLRSYGISLCSLAIYKSTPLPAILPSSLHHQSGIRYQYFHSHIVFLRSVRRLLVTCHPDDGGATFLRNVGSYKSHMA
jgi:hypothetical protein